MEPKRRKARAVTSGLIDHRMPASVVIAKFGGLTRFCDWTGFKTSTAWNWQRKGFIPADRQSHVLERAVRYGIELEASDFVFQPDVAA